MVLEVGFTVGIPSLGLSYSFLVRSGTTPHCTHSLTSPIQYRSSLVPLLTGPTQYRSSLVPLLNGTVQHHFTGTTPNCSSLVPLLAGPVWYHSTGSTPNWSSLVSLLTGLVWYHFSLVQCHSSLIQFGTTTHWCRRRGSTHHQLKLEAISSALQQKVVSRPHSFLLLTFNARLFIYCCNSQVMLKVDRCFTNLVFL